MKVKRIRLPLFNEVLEYEGPVNLPIGADIEVKPSPYNTDAQLNAFLEPEVKTLWLRASSFQDIPIQVIVAVLAHEELHDWLYREYGLRVSEAIDKIPTLTRDLFPLDLRYHVPFRE